MKTLTKENKQMIVGTTSLDFVAYTDDVQEFKNSVHEELIIGAELSLILCDGRKLRLDVPMVHEILMKAYAEDGIEIFSEDEIQ